MSTLPSGDLTPESSSPTDVAPIGGAASKTGSEKTAPAETKMTQWDAIEADPDFRKLLADKLRFIVPTTIFFLVYYFTLPVLVGWWPDLMKKEVLGKLNLAYLFALSQFFMAWAIAFIYVKTAANWDKASDALLAKFSKR